MSASLLQNRLNETYCYLQRVFRPSNRSLGALFKLYASNRLQSQLFFFYIVLDFNTLFQTIRLNLCINTHFMFNRIHTNHTQIVRLVSNTINY